MNQREQRQFYDLITASVEGNITPEQFSELKQMLRSSEQAVQYYIDYMSILSDIRSSDHLFESDSEQEPYDSQFWGEMSDYEKTAPAIEIPEEKSPRELIQKVVYPPRQKRKVSKFNIVFLAMNAAAILLIALFLKFAPTGGIEVATLSDTINAKWADIDSSMQKGTRLFTTNDKLMLREGMAELTFDNHAKAVIEAPAEFQILAEDRIGLNYGRVYAIVPREAIGFSVYTQNAKIVDLGTEFGVQVEADGDTQLYVLKGKTSLIVDSESNGTSMEVTKNTAKRISGVTQEISDIPCNIRSFVREIDSDNQLIWRGENLDLASIVAGRDGFQEAGSLIGLNPATGEFTTTIIRDNRVSKKAFNPVPDSDFIDGVFVPDGEVGEFPITSAGHTFTCTNTAGIFSHEIAVYKGNIENLHETIPPALFNGYEYENEAVVVLHSNVGITIDLQAIRETLPGLTVKSFKATGGITEALTDVEEDEESPDLDFWVIVDGKVRYERKLLTVEDGLIHFDVALAPQDRFLTLIVGDGLRKEDGRRLFPFGNDFFYLIDSELCLSE